jgi:hypothetical protein
MGPSANCFWPRQSVVLMIEQPVTFILPKPWDGQRFTIDRFGELSFLVGPNGSGKSRFADNLKQLYQMRGYSERTDLKACRLVQWRH